MRTITITEDEHGGWSMTDGAVIADRLGSDEMLWCIATMFMGAPTPRFAQTYTQWAAWQERYATTCEPLVRNAPALPDLRVNSNVEVALKMRGKVRRTFDEQGQLVNLYVVPRWA